MTGPERQKDKGEDTPAPLELGELAGCVFSTGSPRTLFAERETGELVHISRLRETEGPLVCPDCRGGLIPVRGDIRIHHFRHQSDRECRTAGETALHKLAKSIIASGRPLFIPALVLEDAVKGRPQTVQPATHVVFNEIVEEVYEEGLRPDLIGTLLWDGPDGPRPVRLVIEVYVTHRVDRAKLKRLRERGESVLEIDLSGSDRQLSGIELEEEILTRAPRDWLFHRSAATHQSRIDDAARAAQAERDRRREAAIAGEARRAQVRSEARSRKAKGASREEREEAYADKLRWRRIHCDSLFSPIADKDMLEVEPGVWKAAIFRPLAPWHPLSKKPLPSAERMAEEMERRGWIKSPFRGKIRSWTGTHSEHRNLVAELIERTWLQNLKAMGYASHITGDALPDQARKSFEHAWSSHLGNCRAVQSLAARFAGRGVTLRMNGQPISSFEDVEAAWLAGDRRPELSMMSMVLRQVAGLFGEGKSAPEAELTAKQMAAAGLTLEDLCNPGLGSADILDALRQERIAAWVREAEIWASDEARACLSVFREACAGAPGMSSRLRAAIPFLASEAALVRHLTVPINPAAMDPAQACRSEMARCRREVESIAVLVGDILGMVEPLGEGAARDLVLDRGVAMIAAQIGPDGSFRASRIGSGPNFDEGRRVMEELVSLAERRGLPGLALAALSARPAGGREVVDAIFLREAVAYRKAMADLRQRRELPTWVSGDIARAMPVPPEKDTA